MKKLTRRIQLPSCRVDKRLIQQLETYFNTRIPALLKKDLTQMMNLYDLKNPASLRTYALTITEGKETSQLESIKQYREESFDPKIKGIKMHLKVGRPEAIDLQVVFSRYAAPYIEIATVNESVKKAVPKVGDQILSIFESWSNKNQIVSTSWFRSMLVLAPLAAVTGSGLFLGADPFFLGASLGWLLILCALLAFNLYRLFPLVSFKTRKHVALKRLGAIALLTFNLSMIGFYIFVLFVNLGLFTIPTWMNGF
jgi:maltodextrin utilization protein YvdJ